MRNRGRIGCRDRSIGRLAVVPPVDGGPGQRARRTERARGHDPGAGAGRVAAAAGAGGDDLDPTAAGARRVGQLVGAPGFSVRPDRGVAAVGADDPFGLAVAGSVRVDGDAPGHHVAGHEVNVGAYDDAALAATTSGHGQNLAILAFQEQQVDDPTVVRGDAGHRHGVNRRGQLIDTHDVAEERGVDLLDPHAEPIAGCAVARHEWLAHRADGPRGHEAAGVRDRIDELERQRSGGAPG